MTHGCFYQSSDDCWNNEIAEYDSNPFPEAGYSQIYVRNSDGLPLITITIWD
jgi:hypothetical protein